MENKDAAAWFFTFVGVVGLSALIGWYICSLSGGYFADNFASARQFAVVGGGIGFWLGWYFATSSTPPLLTMAGAAIAGYWWVGLQRVAQVFRTGPTSISEAFGQETMKFQLPDYVSFLDLWYVNLIVGLIVVALIVAQLSQENHH